MSDKKNEKVSNEKSQALALAVSSIEKQFGKGSIMRLGNNESLVKDVEAISTGSLSLDIALGIGGLPKGRIVEIYGPESSGKTTLCLSVIAQAQKKGGVVAFVDAEHALDINYARKLGVDTSDMLISQPDTGEQALEIVETLVRSGSIDVLVVDSVAALTPRAEIEGDMGDSHMGLQARMMSQAMRKLTAAINRSGTLVIFINQIRMKIGVMFGNPETTTGGNALKFYSSVRLDVRRSGAVKKGEDVIGAETTVKVVKNKMAPPFTKVTFDLMYGEGISAEGDLLDLAVTANMVEKSGAWFSINGERMGQGRDQAKQFLKDNPQYMKELRSKILSANGIGKLLADPKGNDGEDHEGSEDNVNEETGEILEQKPGKKGPKKQFKRSGQLKLATSVFWGLIVSDLPFGKPPKKEKKTKKFLRQKSLRPGRDPEIKKMLSLLPHTQFKEDKPVEKKYSSIKPKQSKPIERSPLKKTSDVKSLKRTPIKHKSKKKPIDPEVQAIRSQLPLAVERRVEDRVAVDACKALPCVITGFVNPTDPEEYKNLSDFMKVDPCHVGTRGSGAPDVWWNMVPMQRRFHQEQGSMPIKDFADKYPAYTEALRVRGWYWDELGNLWNDKLAAA